MSRSNTSSQSRSRYTIGHFRGAGSQGSVYEAIDEATGEHVAIKKYRVMRNGVWDDNLNSSIQNEALCLGMLRNPSILRLSSIEHAHLSPADMEVWMVTEALDGDLRQYINAARRQGTVVPNVNIKFIMYQLLLALKCTHENHVVHRDVKLGNILIDLRSQTIRLADFGLAKYGSGLFGMPRRRSFGTPGYRPPEILCETGTYSFAVDIWGAAVVFASLAGCEDVFPDRKDKLEELISITKAFGSTVDVYGHEMPRDVLNILSRFRYSPTMRRRGNLPAQISRIGEDGVELMLRMFELDWRKRISAERALRSPYFDEVRTYMPQ